MASKHYLVGGAAALLAAAVITACSSSKDVVMQQAVDPLFQSYAALGNSITAGYQSGGINDSTQKQAYGVLFAQMANTRFALPNLAMPGCAPPVDTFPSHRVTPIGYPTSIATTCYLRATTSVTYAINNVAVPGAASIDPVSSVTPNQNALTSFILGGATQVQRASQVNPTFVSMWIGNNDVLAAALSGILFPVPGVSPGVTTQANFVTNYKNDINGLRAIASLKGGVLLAVIDVTNVPLLFHSNLLFVPAIKGAFDAAAGTVTVVDPSCNNAVSLINFQLAGAIKANQHLPAVTCVPTPMPPVHPLDPLFGQIYVLDVTEVPLVQADVAGYNGYIKAKADSLGWAYVDLNPTLVALKTANLIPPFPNLLSPTQTFGTYFTLDGVHPSGLSHQAIANLMIDSVNAKYGTSVPNVP